MKGDKRSLESNLAILARRGGLWVRRARVSSVWCSAARFALPFTLVVPIGFLALRAAAQVGRLDAASPWSELGFTREDIGRWALLALATLAVPSLVFLGQILVAGFRTVRKGEALAAYDEQLGLEGRLQAAEALARARVEGPFAAAAIDDAGAPALRAVSERLEPVARVGEIGGWRWLLVPLSCVLIVLAALLPARDPLLAERSSTGSERVPSPVVPGGEETSRRATGARERLAPRPRELPPGEIESPGGEQPERLERRAGEDESNDDEVADARGKTRGGKPSSAPSTGRAERSRGTPGDQSPESKPDDGAPRTKKRLAKKKPKGEEDEKPRKKKIEEKTGSTAGRGSSMGSSRNPAASEWSSKDRVEESEEEALEDEDDVDDEESESEARGGLQPNLRDRRPPVNRDLTIGFGNRPNPDANGRGGPGQRKKSRGVASLVLGVPIPDHVRGQPNPGRVKITQERVRPQREGSDVEEATDRSPRATPMGELRRPPLEPWMRRLVRDYFLEERQRGAKATTSPEISTEQP